ncbi:MAG TPA: tyrosine-type recombinase/integrase [Novosphingobium sp.]|nr:tyrosine-type recombinase/integrase [Novosphingobium sp.]
MPRRVTNALTPLAVKSAKPGRHADGGGLYLLVKESGARSWLYRATIAGKVRDIGLGAAAGSEAVPLAQARELARGKAAEAKAGSVPVSDRRKRALASAEAQAAKVAQTTFREAAAAHIALHEDGWRNDKHRWQWGASLEAFAYPHFGDMPVSDVATEHVIAALQPIWREKPETARRVRGRIETVLDAAKVRGLRTGENPARWRGHLDQVLPKRALHTRGHHAALPYAEVPAFAAALAKREAVAARALEFTLLTAARTGEVIGATWGEIDLAAAVWTVPAARMKAGREHRVPLSPRAVAILKEVQPLNTNDSAAAAVFPAQRGGKMSNMAMMMLMRRMRAQVTVHGFRSAFRDWAAERTGFAHEVCEMALAHTIRSAAEAAYRRGDLFEKRRKLMEAWATYCTSPAVKGKVTPIRATVAQ